MLAPVPARLKEWAYAGFAITLASALIAHLSVGDGPEAWGWAAGDQRALGTVLLLLAAEREQVNTKSRNVNAINSTRS